MISCVGQSAQVPDPHAKSASPPAVDASHTSYGGSPSGGSTSGYGSTSYASPSSDFDQFESALEQAEMNLKLEEPPLQLLPEVCPSPPFPDPGTFWPRTHPPQYGYQTGKPFMNDLDPMYGGPPYQDTFGGLPTCDSPYNMNKYGAIASTNFMYSNYPQTAESSPVDLSPKPNMQHTLCKVCGDTASGNHFGVLSCEACKSFFRRSIRANARYSCRGSRACAIEKHTRNRCQYCRLQKCMSMGMRKEGMERVSEWYMHFQIKNGRVGQGHVYSF